MPKIKMARGVTLTFDEGCKKYLENCRQRNLKDGNNPQARYDRLVAVAIEEARLTPLEVVCHQWQ